MQNETERSFSVSWVGCIFDPAFHRRLRCFISRDLAALKHGYPIRTCISTVPMCPSFERVMRIRLVESSRGSRPQQEPSLDKFSHLVCRAFSPALFLGFGTASSAATMPVTMQNAEDFGAESSIVKFVVPLGTNFNRQGTFAQSLGERRRG